MLCYKGVKISHLSAYVPILRCTEGPPSNGNGTRGLTMLGIPPKAEEIPCALSNYFKVHSQLYLVWQSLWSCSLVASRTELGAPAQARYILYHWSLSLHSGIILGGLQGLHVMPVVEHKLGMNFTSCNSQVLAWKGFDCSYLNS